MQTNIKKYIMKIKIQFNFIIILTLLFIKGIDKTFFKFS